MRFLFALLLVGCSTTTTQYTDLYPSPVSDNEIIYVTGGARIGERTRARYYCLDPERQMFWRVDGSVMRGRCLTPGEVAFTLKSILR